MALTTAQLQAIKAVVVADSTANGYMVAGDMSSLTAWLNDGGGDLAWKSSLTQGEIAQSLVEGSAEVDNLTPGKRDTLFFLSENGGMVDARKANTRQSFINLTAGNPSDATTVRSTLNTLAKRALRRWEKPFATGPAAGAYSPTLEGNLPIDEVNKLPTV